MTNADQPILVADKLSGGFKTSGGFVQILHDVSFEVRRHTMTAIVGETGSGKSISALCVLGIQPNNFVRTGGRIRFEDIDIFSVDEATLRQIRGNRVSMVFQDARAALNPVISIGRQLADVCRLHRAVSKKEAAELAIDGLRRVQIPEPARRARQFGHELSGGMAQRVMIAMAMLCEPELLILDEPTTGLDVTTQAEIMALIGQLQADTGMSVLLITHDLGVVASSCDEVVVMNAGRVVETATCEALFTVPKDDYTKTLLAASLLVEGAA
jgi:ABC-type dipeptide/oligopeptide/nickel transport system ATPase component